MSSGKEDHLEQGPLPAQRSSLITATTSRYHTNYIAHCVIDSSRTKKLQLRWPSNNIETVNQVDNSLTTKLLYVMFCHEIILLS